jgi:Reverse transcriptase (RNA-dependent DNA polymerase)
MKKKIKELLTVGYIEPSNSLWSTLILFIRKKDGMLRMCINYHTLNAITIQNEYPLSRINAIFNRLVKVRYFSMLDLNMVYHQVQLDNESKEYTAFTCEERYFQFKVMTFEFINTPSTFQHMMIDYLRNMVGCFIEVYLDDILVYSKT